MIRGRWEPRRWAPLRESPPQLGPGWRRIRTSCRSSRAQDLPGTGQGWCRMCRARAGIMTGTTGKEPRPVGRRADADSIGANTRFSSLEVSAHGATEQHDDGARTPSSNASEGSARRAYARLFGPGIPRAQNAADFKPIPRYGRKRACCRRQGTRDKLAGQSAAADKARWTNISPRCADRTAGWTSNWQKARAAGRLRAGPRSLRTITDSATEVAMAAAKNKTKTFAQSSGATPSPADRRG